LEKGQWKGKKNLEKEKEDVASTALGRRGTVMHRSAIRAEQP
jgi:hypothetical protein